MKRLSLVAALAAATSLASVPAEAAPRPIKVRAIGDSVASGFGLTGTTIVDQGRWAWCAKEITTKGPYTGCDNHAASYSGQMVSRSLGRFAVDYRNQAVAGARPADFNGGRLNGNLHEAVTSRPNLVTLSLGANDILAKHAACFMTVRCASAAVQEARTSETLAAILSRFVWETNAKIVIVPYMRTLASHRLAGVMMREYREAIAQLGAKAQGRIFFSALPNFALHDCKTPWPWVLYDCIHPNYEGATRYARGIVKTVNATGGIPR